MSEPIIEVLGIYKIQMSDQELIAYMKESYGELFSAQDQDELFKMKREEIMSVMGLDISVMDANDDFNIIDFKQADSDQVAYDEVYLSDDGKTIESTFKPNNRHNFRVYFFLHFFDPNKPLLSSYGEIKIPSVQVLPEYLKSLHPYTPVD